METRTRTSCLTRTSRPRQAGSRWPRANDGLFRALCSVLGLETLSSDERFATNAARVEHRGELVPLLAGALPGAPRGGLARRPRRRRSAGGQGAHGARRAGGRRGGGPRRDGHGGAPDGRAAGPGGLADLGRDAPRPVTAAAAGGAHGGGAGRAGPLAGCRSPIWRRGAWSGSADRRATVARRALLDRVLSELTA